MINDDDLRERLRRSDPLGNLPPADPRWVEQLLEDTMKSTLKPSQGARPRWLAAGAAAAAALILAGGTFALTRPSANSVQAKPAPTVTTPSARVPGDLPVLQSDPRADAMAACMSLSPSLIATAATAFEGRVTAITPGTPTVVTLEVDAWFVGQSTATIVAVEDLSAPDQPRYLPEWSVGGRYLVAADGDGILQMCGPTGEWSANLAQMFDEAFAR